ncbi:MAG: cyclic pyranopterin monophosphate synthase MoaC [Microscillaceae bacterium]|nr:cyclic pyranopterin monophosphate synthase MoaC [Microscillaceae bacterium]
MSEKLNSSSLSHIDPSGNPSMVDVGDKNITERFAKAQAKVILSDEILALLQGREIYTKKGAVFQTAIIAGTMAAKKTSDLIPLCHPIGLTGCKFDIQINEQKEVVIECTVKVSAQTGVEMEALTGATVAALTIYDMCKALSHYIVISEVKLLEKTGGKKDFKNEA